jgi:hypothetical protein
MIAKGLDASVVWNVRDAMNKLDEQRVLVLCVWNRLIAWVR